MKRLFIAISLIGLLYWGYMKSIDNFSISNISLNNWVKIKDAPFPTPEQIAVASEILEQPFRYMGRGRQCFVFESEDGNYILKFIKCQRVNVSTLYETFPLPKFLDKKRKAKIKERRDRLKQLLTSYSLAFDPLTSQTGVLFCSIQPMAPLQKQVTLIDKLGMKHSLDMAQAPFVLQQKGTKVMPLLKELLAKGDKKQLKVRLNQLVDLFVERSKTAVINPDNSLFRHCNIGFTKTRAIYLDVGTFVRRPKASRRKYLKEELNQLRPVLDWLKKHDENLADYFEKRLNQERT